MTTPPAIDELRHGIRGLQTEGVTGMMRQVAEHGPEFRHLTLKRWVVQGVSCTRSETFSEKHFKHVGLLSIFFKYISLTRNITPLYMVQLLIS